MIRTYDDLPISLRNDIASVFAGLSPTAWAAVARVNDALRAVVSHIEQGGVLEFRI